MKYYAVLLMFACCLLLGTAKPEPVTLSVRCDKDMPRYACQEEAGFIIRATRGDKPVSDIVCHYSLKYAGRPRQVIRRGTVELKNGTAVIRGTLAEPGFLFCMAWLEGGKPKNQSMAGAAFEPEKIRVATTEPADFDAFWQDGLKRQAACPPVQLQKLDKWSNDRYTTYLVIVPVIDGTSLYGYLTEPNAPGKYPAVVHLPGAGAGHNQPLLEWIDRDVISLRMNVHAFRPADSNEELKQQYRDAYGKINYLRHNTTDPEKHIYRRVHLGISRAIDFVASRPNYDGKHFVSYGSSQGGTLGFAQAALNKHLTAVAGMVPGFGDHAGYLLGRSNSHLLILNEENPENLAKALHTAGYYDSAIFARRVTIPALLSAGYIDQTCTPASVYAIYNELRGGKRMIDSPRGPHALLPEVRREMVDFVAAHLGPKNK